MKRIVYALFLLMLCQQAVAQRNIETRLGYSYNDPYEFSDEWQYLSTDIYLYNGNRFTRVLNELERGVKRRKKNYGSGLEHLFITAQLKNMKLFGNDELVYPLFNFSINNDRKEYKTHVSDHLEVVRVIDKMPLASSQRSIDAVISAKAITNSESDQVFSLVANQLVNISKLANPSTAVLSLVGEFGNLLNARSGKREYKFSSTIRLYEGQDFDTRLHSVRIYVFVPSDVKAVSIKPVKLADYLQKHPNRLDRKQLEEVIGYKDYPFMVVANYKSLYKMDVLTGDEVTQELIEKRKQKIQNAYEHKLVNDETYRQEKLYVEFLRVFADMKQNLNIYRLNYRNNSPEVNAKNLFAIVQEYKRLKATWDAREMEFKDNSTYQHIFRPEYLSILNNADLYLEGDHNLKNGKLLVNTLRDLESDSRSWNTPEKREAALTRLYAVELPKPEFLSASVEGEAIIRLIKRLEDQQYNEVFAPEVKRLEETVATDETLLHRNALMEKATTSKCQSCRDKVRETIADYNKRYESFKLKQALKKKEELNQEAEQTVLKYLKQQVCIQNNLQAVAAKQGTDAYMNRVHEKSKEFATTIKALDELNKQEPEEVRLQKVQEYNTRLERLMGEVAGNFELLYSLDKSICDCGEAS
ncbi:hypothetical protein CLV24_101260 [Pontibacter ummariensis]|uniref:Uncharacterized protein n=1 Tax=Pontibacter ummariensis TaxID=1610492 RepID=A0A239BA61_9BACT|nr:hypothetical protein [Pontibacter ummariensis]PRY16414.1 hypothetical protein CLV24_101260 [Pontibacter ummariensis]SNS04750.1 hypothetical protein SAMN06296052_101260 [Pontibacter ummariensis]